MSLRSEAVGIELLETSILEIFELSSCLGLPYNRRVSNILPMGDPDRLDVVSAEVDILSNLN